MNAEPVTSPVPDIIHTAGFEGPLDLLLHLIEKHQIDIYDIPISQVADQYLAYLQAMMSIDLEIASEFLVMASTLLHIKSRMLLPSREAAETDMETDPREELVIRLLEYRRCRALTDELRIAHDVHWPRVYRLPEPPARLGLNLVRIDEPIQREAFFEACDILSHRNRIRFSDLSSKMTHILQREKVSLRDKVRFIWDRIVEKAQVLFHEIFPDAATRSDRVTGFLALLELLRLNKVKAKQAGSYDVIHISPVQEHPQLQDEELSRFLADGNNDMAEYN